MPVDDAFVDVVRPAKIVGIDNESDQNSLS